MNDKLKHLIEEEYGIAINNVVDGPRQFVAETYILNCGPVKYFCKMVSKPTFVAPIIESLPVLYELHVKGFERANYPIPTKTENLYMKDGETLVVLFNYIDAVQTQDYDYFAFGKLIAELHLSTSKITVPVAKENYEFRYATTFGKQLEEIVTNKKTDNVSQLLNAIITQYHDEIKQDYDNYLKMCEELKTKKFEMAITHGDPGGNTLVKSKTDLYLIDWDNILLAPPERDNWFFHHEPEFLRGYQSIFPNYQENKELSCYFTYKRYFEDLVEYFTEIMGNGTDVHRFKNLNYLKEDCLEGWLRPAIRQLDDLIGLPAKDH